MWGNGYISWKYLRIHAVLLCPHSTTVLNNLKKIYVVNIWNCHGCTSSIVRLWLYYVLIAELVIVT